MEKILDRAIEVITRFNQVEGPAVTNDTKSRFRDSLTKVGMLEFGVFACPPINARLLRSNTPEDYILTSPEGTNFEKGGKDQRIDKLLRALNDSGVKSRINVVIGDTDEEDYVFPVVTPPAILDPIRLEERRSQFYQNFLEYLSRKFQWQLQIDRYSEIDGLFDDTLPEVDLSDELTRKDLKAEAAQMREFFGKGEYYDGLEWASPKELSQMADLKFRTYARQGRRLVQIYPGMVLIQNEFPLYQRTRMINLLNDQLKTPLLPAIYPIQDRRRRWIKRGNF